jgi:hypothetical protein
LNTGLGALEPLVGEWSMEATPPGGEPWPGGGTAEFEWIDDGAFLRETWAIDLPEAPNGVAIFGCDRRRDLIFQLYTDERDVHRIYEVTLEDGEWRMWRDADDPFPQRFSATFSDDGNSIAGRWEKQEDGEWGIDFELTYRRLH